jgi:predicted SAM-dependent methyltransferase
MTVEIVEDHGAVYTVVEPYEPEKVEPKNNIVFQKKLRIEPAFLQQAPNSKTAPPDLGFIKTSEDQVWTNPTGPNSNPKFKFRITSQKTQRKIDLNVEFTKNISKTAEEEGEMILEWK